MLVFNYAKDAPYMHYGIVDDRHELVHWIDVPLPGPRLPHDMAFTDNYAILNDCPLFWDADLLAQGAHVPRFRPDLPTRFAVIPRRGTTADIRWFEAEPTYVLHWTNAYEDGDEIVLDGFFQGDPMPKSDGETDLYRRALDVHGVVMEFGVRWGSNLALFQSLRGIYEPYNYTRKIIGFDTFAGFPSVSEQDGDDAVIAPGAYGVSEGY